MITNDILSLIIRNFYSGPDHEYLIIEEAQKEAFWQWFQYNADHYLVVIQPEKAMNRKFLPSRCIGNSQIAADDLKIKYLEGFASRGERFIFHGFNAEDNGVVDVTTLNHPQNFLDHFGGLPNLYIGVSIPNDYMLHMNGLAIAEENEHSTAVVWVLLATNKHVK
ncbi:hypothetical protein [Pedobacter deserti]|uniref:hypothetical protein n=1 Tax=Pedobacter deserti TaxID=2817382 RepID=UPI0021092F95|nr:hypothetical protein [Pedobacter sp. SYSU D00382]